VLPAGAFAVPLSEVAFTGLFGPWGAHLRLSDQLGDGYYYSRVQIVG
jgi:hypothetical protein